MCARAAGITDPFEYQLNQVSIVQVCIFVRYIPIINRHQLTLVLGNRLVSTPDLSKELAFLLLSSTLSTMHKLKYFSTDFSDVKSSGPRE